MLKFILILVVLVTFTDCCHARKLPIKEVDSVSQNNNTAKTIVDHSAWDGLLKKYVTDNGNVNYKGFKMDAKALNAYIDYLATQVPTKDWSVQEQLAYFINVYNANTVKLIIDNYPTKSIKNIKNPWSKKRIKIGAKNYSLSEIENDILRKMNEPRIHFAINCASASCPRLLNMAYTAKNVETLLDRATKAFISNPEKNKISEHHLQLSKIFKWYKSDFTHNGSLIDYINQYSSVKINPDASIDYLEYNWNLNEQN